MIQKLSKSAKEQDKKDAEIQSEIKSGNKLDLNLMNLIANKVMSDEIKKVNNNIKLQQAKKAYRSYAMKEIKSPIRFRKNFNNTDELYDKMKEIESLFNSYNLERIVMRYSGIAQAGPSEGKRYFIVGYKHGRSGSSESKMKPKVKNAADKLSQLLDDKGYPNTIKDLWKSSDEYLVVLD